MNLHELLIISRTLIDHIFTTVPTKVRCTKVPKIGLSDHFPTIVVYKDSFGTKNMHTTIKCRSYKECDKDTFLEDLQWSVLDSLSNINDVLDIFYKCLLMYLTNMHH